MGTTYLDANGNPIPAPSAPAANPPAKTYLDDSGNPIAPPQPTNDWLARSLGQQNQTDLERWLQPTPHSADQGVLGNVKTAFSNIGAAGLNALTHPEQLITSAVTSFPPVAAYNAVRDTIKHYQGKPNASDEMASHPAQNIESAIGTAGALGMADAFGTPVLNGVETAKNYFRPPTSPSIVPPTEMAARNLAAAVLPATKDASNFIQAAQQEVPNVIDYAKRTGNPLNTQLEFSKAAQGYAQEVRDMYEKNVLGPVENKLVRTTGTGYGSRKGEGPDTYATLGDIDTRIGEINKQLDAPTLNADDARRALASKTELQQQAAGLRNILHDNLSQATGIPADQIADIRQRVGRSYELANDTNAAVTQRMQAVGKSELGPVNITQLPSRAIEFARGGPVPIADRAFQRAIANFPGQATPLPAVSTPPSLPASTLDQLLAASKKRLQDIRTQF